VSFWTSGWAWALLWLVLVLASGAFLALVARRLLRQGAALARELGAALELLGDLERSAAEAQAAVQADRDDGQPSGSREAAEPKPARRRSRTGGTLRGRRGPGRFQDVR
jgi:hypothetical protein